MIVQVSVSLQFAIAFGLKHHNQVLISTVGNRSDHKSSYSGPIPSSTESLVIGKSTRLLRLTRRDHLP